MMAINREAGFYESYIINFSMNACEPEFVVILRDGLGCERFELNWVNSGTGN